MSGAKDRGAVLQFEISREWWNALHHIQLLGSNDGARHRLFALASTACSDVLRNGGTFVLVVGKEKITMVQRPDAEDVITTGEGTS